MDIQFKSYGDFLLPAALWLAHFKDKEAEDGSLSVPCMCSSLLVVIAAGPPALNSELVLK